MIRRNGGNGDCHYFAKKYPGCLLEELGADMNGTAAVVLVDAICDRQACNITECGYENGDW
jgi:hypothetical protein